MIDRGFIVTHVVDFAVSITIRNDFARVPHAVIKQYRHMVSGHICTRRRVLGGRRVTGGDGSPEVALLSYFFIVLKYEVREKSVLNFRGICPPQKITIETHVIVVRGRIV